MPGRMLARGSSRDHPGGHAVGRAPPASLPLTRSWEQVDANGDEVDPPTVTLSSATAARPTFAAPFSGETLRFRLTVTGKGGSHTAP